MEKIKVVPSLPAQSFAELSNLATRLEGQIDEIQVDIVDGHFVPLKAWPFTVEKSPTEELKDLSKLPSSISIEMDCMVMHPEQYLDLFVELGVVSVIVHVGSTNKVADIIKHARANDYRIGLAFTNDIPLVQVAAYISEIDFVQVMGIAEVGKQGQPFDERTLDTVRTLREQFPNLTIAVDGSVNASTIIQLVEAGANRLAPGSAIAKAEDPVVALKHLKELAGEI